MRTPGGGRIPLKTFLKRLYEEYGNHALSDNAATLAYYFVFSLFPLLFFLTTLTAYLPLGHSVETLLARTRAFIPAQGMDPVSYTHLTLPTN